MQDWTPARFRVLMLISSLTAAQVAAQSAGRSTITAADYARAERFLGANTNPLVDGIVSQPVWLRDGRYLYRVSTAKGYRYITVDPVRRTRTLAFDHDKLAAALSTATKANIAPSRLGLSRLEFAGEPRSLTFQHAGKRYACRLADYRLRQLPRPRRSNSRDAIVAPDGKRAAFIRDHNLWLRDLGTGRETRLTTDGVQDFGYATNNAGWVKRDSPVLEWSADSRRTICSQRSVWCWRSAPILMRRWRAWARLRAHRAGCSRWAPTPAGHRCLSTMPMRLTRWNKC
jgi:hypothetical protein